MKIFSPKIFLLLIAIILVVLAILPVYIDPIAKKIVEQKVYPIFENRLKVGAVNISFLRRMLEINDIELLQQPEFGKGNVLKVKSIKAWIAPFPLLRNHLLIRNITITNPEVTVVLLRDGSINTDYIFQKKQEATGKKVSEPSTSTPTTKAVTIHLNKLSIKNASITLYNYKVRTQQPTLVLVDFNLDVENLDVPNPEKTKTSFTSKGAIASSLQHKAPIYCSGEGILIPKLISLTAQNKIENLFLADFYYVNSQMPIIIREGNAWVTSQISLKNDSLDSRHHVKVKNLKVSSKDGSSIDKQLLGLAAGGLLKVMDKTNTVLEFDFQVKGNFNNIKFKLRETFIEEITKSIKNKMKAGASTIKGTGDKAKGFGTTAKDSFIKLFKFKK